MNEIVKLTSDRLEVEIWTLGARLNGVWFDGIGSLVDGAASEDEARGAKKYNGAVVGPVANRIANASAELDGIRYDFEANEAGKTCLHSGGTGVHAQYWHVNQISDVEALLSLDLPDGLGGFPGNRNLTANYRIDHDQLYVEFEAVSDAPTWINLALHPYWSLGCGRDDLELALTGYLYTPVDDDKIPLGCIVPVRETIFDLRKQAPPSTEIDHNFEIRDQPAPQVVLASPDLRLEIETDAPGVQIYSGKDIGIAIEPQHFPDAMHNENFPSIELRPGETYHQFSTYRFSSR